jgi:hypothetical protein
MKAVNRKTGLEIDGTLETLSGRAEILNDSYQREADGSIEFEWGGETEVFWDEQRTVTRGGKRIFLDTEGNECTEDEIDLVVDLTEES